MSGATRQSRLGKKAGKLGLDIGTTVAAIPLAVVVQHITALSTFTCSFRQGAILVRAYK